MTENMNAQPAGEEPDSTEERETHLPEVDELPTVTDEAMQTTAIVEPTNVPETPSVVDEATQITPSVLETPQIAPAKILETLPVSAADQPSAPTEAVQPVPFEATAQPAQFQQTTSQPTFYAQPGQPQFLPGGYTPYPGQPVSAAPVAKKRRVGLWIALIVLVVLVIGGGTTAFALTLNHGKNQVAQKTTQEPSPNDTLQMYCQDVMSSNAQGIYDLLSEQAKVHTSLDDLQQKFAGVTEASSLGMDMQYTACTFSNVRVSGTLAVATISLTTSLTMQVQGQSSTMTSTAPDLVSLVWESGQWKIDFSSFAQPQPKVTLPNFTLPTPTPSN
jgi:hypothetical protein